MLLAQIPAQTDMSGPQTIIGLLALAASLIIADWIKNRGKNQREESKVSELSQQTRLATQQLEMLSQIRDSHEYESIRNKKARRRLKIIARQVKDLHSKHIKPEQSHEK